MIPSSRLARAYPAEISAQPALVAPVGPVDVRWRRERVHRRAAVALARRILRVVALHFADATVLVLAASLIAHGWPGFFEAKAYVPALVAITLLSLNASSAYHAGEARRDGRRLLQGLLLALLTLGALSLLAPETRLPLVYLAVFGLGAGLALVVERQLIDLLVRQAYLRGVGLRRAVVIGTASEIAAAMERMRSGGNVDQCVVGRVRVDAKHEPGTLGRLADLPEVIERYDVQEVVLTAELSRRQLDGLASTCAEQGAALLVLPSVLRVAPGRVSPERVGGCLLLHVYPPRLQVPRLPIKRLFDLVVATLLLIGLAPLLTLIAIAVRLDSPGPVFFRQERVGLGGRRFVMWKFRSMFANAHAVRASLHHLNSYGDGRLFKLERDPRVTRVGRLLRRTSLDELPQLFNVLTGDMSLVGPRPPLPSEVERYEASHYVRLSVVPGITGPWQVSGRNLITDFETVVRLEREYISRWSLGLDLKILLRTVRVVVTGEGAY